MTIEEFKEKTKPTYQGGSLIKKYTNGYEAHLIDKHPHGEFYRDINNSCGVVAYPEEKIMLLQSAGCVVVFLKDRSELGEIEKSMKLQSI